MEFYAEEYLAESGDGHPYASPLLAEDCRLAPAHILTAEFDMLRDSGGPTRAVSRRRVSKRRSTACSGNARGERLWQTWEPARDWMDEVVRTLESTLHSPSPL